MRMIELRLYAFQHPLSPPTRQSFLGNGNDVLGLVTAPKTKVLAKRSHGTNSARLRINQRLAIFTT